MKPDQLRNNNKNIFLKIFLIGLVSIVIALIGYYIVVVNLFPAFSLSASGEVNWNLLEGFASVLSLALLTGGFTFALTEYINTENAKLAEKLAEDREKAKLSYDIYKAIFDKLTDPEQEEARRWILSNVTIKKDDEDIAVWYKQTHAKIMKTTRGNKDGLPEGQEAVKITLNCFDYIGFIAVHYWDIEDDSLDWISAPIAKVWRRIGPYVEHVRTLRGSNEYYISAEYIGRLCIKWRQDKGLPDEKYVKETP
jgi:hypothetical protein